MDPASSASTDGVEEKKAAVRASYASAASKNVLTKKKVVDSPASSYADGEASVIQVTKKKSSRGPAVAESLARGRGGGGSGADRPRSSNSRASPRKQMHYQQQGGDRVTPSRYSKQQQARDEDCFGEHIDDGDIGTDFDFEGNLAMFDKRVSNNVISSLNTCMHSTILIVGLRGDRRGYRLQPARRGSPRRQQPSPTDRAQV